MSLVSFISAFLANGMDYLTSLSISINTKCVFWDDGTRTKNCTVLLGEPCIAETETARLKNCTVGPIYNSNLVPVRHQDVSGAETAGFRT